MIESIREMEAKDDGIEEGKVIGREEGREETKIEDIKLLLKEFKPQKIIELGFDEKIVTMVKEEIEYPAK